MSHPLLGSAGGKNVNQELSTKKHITLPETNSSHPKMDGWNTFSFPFGMAYFQVRTVSFREGSPFPTNQQNLPSKPCMSQLFGRPNKTTKRQKTHVMSFVGRPKNEVSNEKRARGWFRYVGDEILPSYMGIIINQL